MLKKLLVQVEFETFGGAAGKIFSGSFAEKASVETYRRASKTRAYDHIGCHAVSGSRWRARWT